MNAPMLVQTLLIALAVAWSVLFAFRRLLPNMARRAQAHIAEAIAHSSAPAWLRARAEHWQPRSTSGGSCADGCSSCGGCATAAAKPVVEAQPLVFRPRTRP